MGRVLQHHTSVHDARQAVLSAVRQIGNVRQACAAAGVSKSWLYWQLAHRPSFKRRWEKALEAYKVLEKERRARAELQQMQADNNGDWRRSRGAVSAILAMWRKERKDKKRWEKQAERRYWREQAKQERDAWRAANPNWRQLEREAREGWQRVMDINRRIIAEEAERERPMPERTQSRRGFDPPERYDPDC